MTKKVIVAGAFVRGRIRRILLLNEASFTEDKGLFESYFFVSNEDAWLISDLLVKE